MISSKTWIWIGAIGLLALPGCLSAPSISAPNASLSSASAQAANAQILVSQAAPQAAPASPATTSTPAAASAQKPDCGNAQTQALMNQCAASGYQAADAELNRVYQQLRRQLDPASQNKLMVAEQKWIEFRDANCAFESDRYAGGSIQPLIHSSCMQQMTQERTAQLQRQLQDLQR